MGMLDGLLGHGSEVSGEELTAELNGLLLENETVHIGYRLIRDYIAFTQLRVIVVDIQGVSGRKKQFITVPYNKICRFSVETAGSLDLDVDVRIWTNGGMEPIVLSCKRDTDIRGIQQALSWGVLSKS